MSMIRRILAVTRKELYQLRRDRLTFGMIVGIPLIQLLLFGYAINTDVRNLKTGIADEAGTERSRRVIDALAASQVLAPEVSVKSVAALEDLLYRGQIDVGVFIPADLGRRVLRGDLPAVQVIVDGSDTAVAQAVSGILDIPLPLDPGIAVPKRASLFALHILSNPEKRSAVSIVPGILGVILTMTMALYTSIALVRERERGTLELLITTPIRPIELIFAKILPYVMIGLVQFSLILFLGYTLFDVPIRGPLLHLYLAGFAFICANLAVGLLFSTIAKNQLQSVQLTFFFFLPSILLSGFMFPFAGMPRWAQVIAEGLPLTHFNRLSRGILLRGSTLEHLAHELVPLGIFFGVVLLIVLLRFRKRLD
ncbi:MAG: ABC transporter permease [Deltaproteobacteria bacterium]|nr:MAG: ABC transporter permease [Deltaproteobacteria bacterium]